MFSNHEAKAAVHEDAFAIAIDARVEVKRERFTLILRA